MYARVLTSDFKGVRVLPGWLRDVVHNAELLFARDGRQPGRPKPGVRRDQRDGCKVWATVFIRSHFFHGLLGTVHKRQVKHGAYWPRCRYILYLHDRRRKKGFENRSGFWPVKTFQTPIILGHFFPDCICQREILKNDFSPFFKNMIEL